MKVFAFDILLVEPTKETFLETFLKNTVSRVQRCYFKAGPYLTRGKTRHLPRLDFNPKLKTKYVQEAGGGGWRHAPPTPPPPPSPVVLLTFCFYKFAKIFLMPILHKYNNNKSYTE